MNVDVNRILLDVMGGEDRALWCDDVSLQWDDVSVLEMHIVLVHPRRHVYFHWAVDASRRCVEDIAPVSLWEIELRLSLVGSTLNGELQSRTKHDIESLV